MAAFGRTRGVVPQRLRWGHTSQAMYVPGYWSRIGRWGISHSASMDLLATNSALPLSRGHTKSLERGTSPSLCVPSTWLTELSVRHRVFIGAPYCPDFFGVPTVISTALKGGLNRIKSPPPLVPKSLTTMEPNSAHDSGFSAIISFM